MTSRKKFLVQQGREPTLPPLLTVSLGGGCRIPLRGYFGRCNNTKAKLPIKDHWNCNSSSPREPARAGNARRWRGGEPWLHAVGPRCAPPLFMGADGLARQTQSFPDAGRCTRGPDCNPAAPRRSRNFAGVKPTIAPSRASEGGGRKRSVQVARTIFSSPSCGRVSRMPPRAAFTERAGNRRRAATLFSKRRPPSPPVDHR